MSTWKLPRKRKKAFVKEQGRNNYRLWCRANSIALVAEEADAIAELDLLISGLRNCSTVAAECGKEIRRALDKAAQPLVAMRPRNPN